MSLIPPAPTLGSLFSQSWQIYRSHLFPVLGLTLVLLAPALLLSLSEIDQGESIVFFLLMRLLEAGVTLGLLFLLFTGVFPTGQILRRLRSRAVLRPLHVGILQYLLTILGFYGLLAPAPLNVILVAFWLSSFVFFTVAQPVCVIEELRGLPALVRSFQLTRNGLKRAFGVVVLGTLLQLVIFLALLQLFLPEINFSALLQADPMAAGGQELSALLESPETQAALRWTQYLTALLFYPYAAILTVLLYFDLSRDEPSCSRGHLQALAQHHFGIPAEYFEEPEKQAEETTDRVTLREIGTEDKS